MLLARLSFLLVLLLSSLALSRAQGFRVESKSPTALTGSEGGSELKLEFPDGFAIARIYVVLNRVYQVIASLPPSFKSREPAIALRILDSFHILSPTEIDTELKRKIAEATPSPLPQAPVVRKLKSDAQDEGLRGRVKTVNTESEDLSGTWMVSARKPSSMKHYNQLGNLTEWDSFDYRGNPFEITVYGYVDGFRVSNFNEVEYEYSPPPIVVAGPPTRSKVKSDPAYRYRHMHKYDEMGRLKEELTFESSGRLVTKIAYTYSGNQKQELTYDDDGKLNQRSVTTIDAAGNEIEEADFEITDGSVKEKYRYSYEFDSQGNWTKQTTSKWVTKDGRSSYLPYSIDYRTIIYYQD